MYTIQAGSSLTGNPTSYDAGIVGPLGLARTKQHPKYPVLNPKPLIRDPRLGVSEYRGP